MKCMNEQKKRLKSLWIGGVVDMNKENFEVKDVTVFCEL